MEHRDVPVNLLVNAVLDGEPVDWESAESSVSSEAGRTQIRQFRTVAAIAALHRDAEAAPTRLPATDVPLWGSLQLLDRIGEGSCSEVYRAWDTALEREVALKLLRRRDRAVNWNEDFALEEGRLLARIRHPNVATVFGADRIGERVGIRMELVRGRTLQQVLRAQGVLSAREATAIGLDLCRALSAVHRAGLLHRDVKAQNVMREDGGRIVLMDLGAGQVASTAESGDVAGTPLYLAPEIMRGASASVRSDVYSLGVLLYHLVTGDFPIRGQTAQEICSAHDRGDRVSLVDVRADLPDAFVRVVERALATNPDDRYQSVGALAAALDNPDVSSEPGPPAAASRWFSPRVMLAATALLAVALGLGTWTSRPRPAGPAAPAWILVSEFENHTGDARLAGVLQFAFEQELAQSRALTVVPRERIDDTLRLMKRPAGTRIDSTLAREVAIRDGEISRVAAGRIDQVGQNYSLSVTIRDARSSRSVAGAAVEAPTLDAVLAGVKTVAGRVRAIVGDDPLRLEADGKLEKVTTGSLEALHAYTRGMAFVNERRWEPAELALRDATRLDPAFASAYIMLAHSARNIGRPKDDWLPLARRAMDLSESLPDRERYFIAGSYYGMAGDRRNAVAAYEVLVREHPDDYWGVNNLAGQYDAMGRYSEALAMKLRQARLRPHDFDLNVDAAMNLVGSRSLAEARPFVDRSLSIVPADPQTRVSPRTEINLAWLDTLPVFELWTQGRAREAADRLDRIASRQAFGGRLAQFVGTWNLALGRLRAAEQAFRSLPLEFDRQEFLAFSALARDDKGGVQRVLEDDPRLADPNPAEFQPRLMAVWALVYAGAVDRAAELARHSGTVDDGNAGYAMLWSQIVAARGEADAALSLVRRVPTPVMSNPPALRALAAEAELLAAGHDLDAAAARLRITDSTRGVHLFNGSSGYWWLRARVRLMDVERLLGNASRARAIQEELRQLLAVADPDFVLLRDLN